MAIGGPIGPGGGTATNSTATNSTSTRSIVTCGFGGLQVNQFRIGSSVVVKIMCGTTQIFPDA
jgi:hypothetical protein